MRLRQFSVLKPEGGEHRPITLDTISLPGHIKHQTQQQQTAARIGVYFEEKNHFGMLSLIFYKRWIYIWMDGGLDGERERKSVREREGRRESEIEREKEKESSTS